MAHSPPGIVGILRSTLRQLERELDFRQDDPAVIQLKKHIVQSIAELEVNRESHSSVGLAEPNSVRRAS